MNDFLLELCEELVVDPKALFEIHIATHHVEDICLEATARKLCSSFLSPEVFVIRWIPHTTSY